MAVTPVCTLGPGPEELRVLKPTLRLGTSTRALRGPGWPGKSRLSLGVQSFNTWVPEGE